MIGFVISLIAGTVCIVLGISIMKGNLSSLQPYHIKRVSDEDRIPFGRRVGLGMVLCGIAIVIFSVLATITLYTENSRYIVIGAVCMAVGLIVGIAISIRAIIKYNKGLF